MNRPAASASEQVRFGLPWNPGTGGGHVPRQRQSSDWSRHDAAVLTTVQILASLRSGQIDPATTLVADFPTQLAPHERIVAVGDVEVLAFRPAGGGGYDVQRPAVVVSSGMSAAIAMVGAAVSAAGNQARRRRAAAAARPQWVVEDRGSVWISTAGFYLRTPSGLYPWGWESVRAAALVEPGAIRVDGSGDTSTVSWVLRMEWAELLLLLWILDRHPSHPQLQDGSWLPPGWVDRAHARGLAARPA